MTTVALNQLGSALAKMRREKGWTQQDLARRCGVSKSMIGSVESGRRLPAFETLRRLCTALGVRAALNFVDGRGDENG